MTIDPNTTVQSITNYAEIKQAHNEQGVLQDDVDSTPDTNPGNDKVVADNDVDSTQGDEDDHDPATVIVCTFDLALVKTVSTAQPIPIGLGNDVTFTLTVTNQGNVPAYNINIADYIPAGLTLNDNDWIENSSGTTAQLFFPISGPIAAGASHSVDITFTVNNSFTGNSITNFAEISEADNDQNTANTPPTDIDSTPDEDNSNDGTPSDNVTNNSNGDEDDHDLETINIEQIFDLALTKVLANPTGNYYAGDDVVFTIEVTNQGTIDAYNVDIIDYIPNGMLLNDTDWVPGVQLNTVLSTIAGPITPGSSETVDITLTIDPALAGTPTLTNFAEITDAEDVTGSSPNDVDSDADADGLNDGFYIDGEINNGSGDEDDHDPADVTLQIFDLALVKELSPTQALPVFEGQDATFVITVYNQGTVDATNITITDYVPAGFLLNDSDWTSVSPSEAYAVITDIIPVGGSYDVEVTMTVQAGAAGSDLVNFAEISEAEDTQGNMPDDVDSTPDTNNTDDWVDGVTDNTSDDEDDHDPAQLPVGVFDVALSKVILLPSAGTPVDQGDIVIFGLYIYNQGTEVIQNIELTDYIPAELTLADQDWTQASPTEATYVHSTPIAPGNSALVHIRFTVNDVSSGVITNYAEVSDAEDTNGNHPPDADSTPDNDNTNDGKVDDNEIFENGENDNDEDDHDIEEISTAEVACALVAYPQADGGCIDENVYLTANAIGNAANYTYEWSGPNDFTSLNPNPVIVAADATDAGTYTLTITDGGFCVIEIPVEVELTLCILPIEMSYFRGTEQDCEAILTWGTATEEGVSHFEIEESTDGTTFTEIGRVDAAGNSDTANDYSYIDTNLSEINYYRLRIVELDGAVTYSDILTIQSACTTGGVSISDVFPNPVGYGVVNIRFNSNVDHEDAQVIIRDMLGRTMMQVPFTIFEGTNLITVDPSRLPAATYLITVQGNGWYSQTMPFVKLDE